MSNLDKLSNAVSKLNKAQDEIMPIAADALIEALKSNKKTDSLLQMIGILAGQDLKVEDLLIAVRNKLDAK